MKYEIVVKSGKSVRLPTAGKYCDRDIVIIAEGGGEQETKNLRYIKFVINEVRAGANGTQMQFSEIDFLDADGNRYDWPTTAVVTSPNMAATSIYEAQSKIIDGLTSTKFCTVQFASGAYMLIDLGGKERLDVRKFCRWQWWTANDNHARDPISFELWGSEDGDIYELLDSAVKAEVPTTRQAVAYTNWINIVENNPDTDGGKVEAVLQEKTVTPTKASITIQADEEYDGLSKVIVNPIPDEYIQPSGELTVTKNGQYNVTAYASVNVQVDSYDRGYADGYADGEESKNEIEDALLAKTLTEYRNTRPVTIGNRLFAYCYDLKSVDLPNAVYITQYAFVYCTSLQRIVLPSVTTIEAFAFQDASSLTVVDLHKVKALQSNVFTRTNITTLILRKTDTITTNNSTAVFTSTPISRGEGFIYVPKALIDAYKSATNWSVYASQIRAIEDYPDICGG